MGHLGANRAVKYPPSTQNAMRYNTATQYIHGVNVPVVIEGKIPAAANAKSAAIESPATVINPTIIAPALFKVFITTVYQYG
jgi:hypothetical protein